jgi:hypothetical protein
MNKSICITCGTNKQNNITGYCINDHDNWLESNDDVIYFKQASKNLNKNIEEIENAIKNGVNLS